MYGYSKTTNAFYLMSSKENYQESGTWPDDVKDVDYEVFFEFSGEPPFGKIRVAGKNGYPKWIATPPLSNEELITIAQQEKQMRIDTANAHMNSKQWPGKAAIGRLKGDDLVQYGLWLDYLDALEVVDTSKAPDVEWPIQPV